jgi:hypothetical protein
MIKPSRLDEWGHVSGIGESRKEVHTRFWWGNLRERDLENVGGRR